MPETDKSKQAGEYRPMDLTTWESGLAGLEAARCAQREFGKKLVGSWKLSETSTARINTFLQEDCIPRAVLEDRLELRQPLKKLLCKFEELCRRRHTPLTSPEQTKAAYRILTTEFYANTVKLTCAPEQLITATLLNSELVANIPDEQEFADFLQTQRNTLNRAVTSYPSDPRAFLRKAQEAVKGVMQDEGLAEFHHMEGTLIALAVRRPSRDLKEFVREIHNEAATIQKEPEFREFLRDRKWLAVHAIVTTNKEKARPYLRNVRVQFADLLADDELAPFRKRPGDILTAITRHRKDKVKEFLLGILAKEQAIEPPPGESQNSIRRSLLRTPEKAEKKFYS